jgi:hypothetical protein
VVVQHLLDTAGHAIEGPADLSDLIHANDRNTCGQITLGHLVDTLFEPPERPLL